jgi:pimeloyl-ACP methyl ester carboxylesterase
MDYNTDFIDGKTKTLFGYLHHKHHGGTGKTLIFLHGLGSSVQSWGKLMGFLPADLNIYLIDLLGHGESDAPHINYTVKNQTLVLGDFIKAENIQNAYLAGHSYGAWVAAYYASTNEVIGLVLEDTAGLKIAFDQVVAAKRQEEYKSAMYRSIMELEGNKDYVIKSVLDLEFSSEELDDEVLGRIKEPTMIIWGANDILLNPAIGKILHSKMQNSELEIIEGAGHVPHYTKPEEFAEKLVAFLSKH